MRGKNFTNAERDDIRKLHKQGYPVRKIAQFINRSVAGVQGQISKMRNDGSIAQEVMDLGRFDERK